MDDQPLVSIGIPTRNRVNYLQEAIDSALNQSYSNIEIIVSDNESSDKTREYLAGIQDSRVKVFRQEVMLEMVDNWNVCLKSAIGKYFLLLSDDDVLSSDAIELFLKEFNTVGNSIVYSRVQVINSLGVNIYVSPHWEVGKYESKKEFLYNYYTGKREIFPCATIFPRVFLDSYDNSFYLATDIVAVMLILNKTENIIALNEPIVKYRIHSQNALQANRNVKWLHDYYLLFLQSDRECDASLINIQKKYFFKKIYFTIIRAGIERDLNFDLGSIKKDRLLFYSSKLLFFLSFIFSFILSPLLIYKRFFRKIIYSRNL